MSYTSKDLFKYLRKIHGSDVSRQCEAHFDSHELETPFSYLESVLNAAFTWATVACPGDIPWNRIHDGIHVLSDAEIKKIIYQYPNIFEVYYETDNRF